MAPAVGLEPTTKWLTATYSTIELCRSINVLIIYFDFIKKHEIPVLCKFVNFLEKILVALVVARKTDGKVVLFKYIIVPIALVN